MFSHGPGRPVPAARSPVACGRGSRRHPGSAASARGGGLVEAYPIAGWTHGRDGSAGAVPVQGAGLVAPAHGSFGNVSTTGTVSMFENAGFEAAGTYGSCRVLMRRVI
jgi:hypothetical protein